ncbi:MAG: ABC transporter permease [Thermoanaerobaculia bacterium]|nr:ABC transporter permease [Thermoanaerobaculia bacterium]
MEIGPIFRSLSRNKTRSILLILEIAVTLAIVLNCWNLMMQQRESLMRPSGIDEKNIIAVEVQTFGPDYQDWEYRRQVVSRDVAALRQLPGVIDATPISNFPLQGGGSSLQAKPLGARDTALTRAPVYTVDDHMLRTLDLEIVAGRAFEAGDLRSEDGPVIMNVIVTQDLAEALFPDGDAIGQTIDTGSEEWPDIIVGVVDAMHTPYGGGPMESQILFYPGFASRASGMNYLIRTEPAAFDSVFSAVDGVLLESEPSRVVQVQTLLEIKGGGQVISRFSVQVLSTIIGLLLFVTTLGIYGMTSFSVTQRTKQIGTRRALGASQGAILRYFLLESLVVTLIGSALGLIAASGLDVLIASQMDSERLGPTVLATGILLLWSLAILATIVPALRASKLSPALATRTV